MRLATPLLQHVLEIRENATASLVIENPRLFRDFVQGLYDSVEHGEKQFVLSEDGETLRLSESVEIVQSFVPFDLNAKSLTAALVKKMERIALLPEKMKRTARVVSEVEGYVHELSLEISHEVECEKATIGSVLKAVGVKFAVEKTSFPNLVLDYLRLVRDFLGSRLYVLVNVRSYLNDSELEGLLEICMLEKMRILLVDGVAKSFLPREERLLIDDDLCELTARDDEI